MSNLVKVCALLTIAVLLKLNGYRVPFIHNLEQVGIEPEPTEAPKGETPQQLPPADPIATDFQNYWPSIP